MSYLPFTYSLGNEEHGDLHRIPRRKMLLCMLGVCSASSAALSQVEFSSTSTRTDFVPQQHGFHFSNNFINVILDMPGVYVTTRGRCGGMAYTALDYYFAHLPIPQYSTVPECEPDSKSYGPDAAGAYRLVHYIFARQLDTMINIWPFGRAADFLFYTIASDEDVFQHTTGNELDKLAKWIHAGLPVPLGLIGVRDVTRIGENHQVVAYGYDSDPSSETISSIHIYDPNYPDQSVILFLDRTRRCLRASTGRAWRGFFVRDDYRPHNPLALVHVLL